MKLKFLKLLILSVVVIACKQVPKERLMQYVPGVELSVSNDSLKVVLQNPIAVPLQFIITSQDEIVNDFLSDLNPVVVAAYSDTMLIFVSENLPERPALRLNTLFGDPNAAFSQPVLELPFPRGKSYRVLQGYYGSFSHNTDFSRYAIDFNLAVGDTITAAADGFVVGVIDGYRYGGNNRKWREYANYITLFHPEFNALTQYVHLVYNGSLVALGDTVVVGQPIALSGNTGFTSGPHLHFNVLQPRNKEVVSVAVDSISSHRTDELKRGVVVGH